jgi:hypothetical protein
VVIYLAHRYRRKIFSEVRRFFVELRRPDWHLTQRTQAVFSATGIRFLERGCLWSFGSKTRVLLIQARDREIRTERLVCERDWEAGPVALSMKGRIWTALEHARAGSFPADHNPGGMPGSGIDTAGKLSWPDSVGRSRGDDLKARDGANLDAIAGVCVGNSFCLTGQLRLREYDVYRCIHY